MTGCIHGHRRAAVRHAETLRWAHRVATAQAMCSAAESKRCAHSDYAGALILRMQQSCICEHGKLLNMHLLIGEGYCC